MKVKIVRRTKASTADKQTSIRLTTRDEPGGIYCNVRVRLLVRDVFHSDVDDVADSRVAP